MYEALTEYLPLKLRARFKSVSARRCWFSSARAFQNTSRACSKASSKEMESVVELVVCWFSSARAFQNTSRACSKASSKEMESVVKLVVCWFSSACAFQKTSRACSKASGKELVVKSWSL